MRSPLDFDRLVDTLRQFLDDVFAAVAWQDYRVIAFTTSHQQLIPTVLLAERIKKIFPAKPVVIGGALMTSGLPARVLELFDCFDFVVSGEGEETLTELLSYLTNRSDKQLRDLPGLIWRDEAAPAGTIVENGPRAPIEDLDVLPYPDYDDYFAHDLRPGGTPVLPKITVEASRACVWGKCVYCNLNLQ